MFDVLTSIENTIGAYSDSVTFFATNAQNNQTDGYKKLEWSFQTMFTTEMNHLGQSSHSGISQSNMQSIPTGVRIVPGGFDMSQGGTRAGGPLNAAIQGHGFFVLQQDNNSDFLYSRASDWVFDANGTLRDTLGRRVKGYATNSDGTANTSGGLTDIAIDFSSTGVTSSSVGIEDGGLIVANFAERKAALTNGTPVPDAQVLFQLGTARIPNQEMLQSATGNAFKQTTLSGTVIFGKSGDTGIGTVLGGNIEESNVEIAELSIQMQQIQRGFNIVQQSLQVALKMLTSVTEVVGKA